MVYVVQVKGIHIFIFAFPSYRDAVKAEYLRRIGFAVEDTRFQIELNALHILVSHLDPDL